MKKIILKIISSFLMIFLFFMISSCDPFNTIPKDQDITYYTSNKIIHSPSVDTLKIMTWNIKFGSARLDLIYDCQGDIAFMTEQQVKNNLQQLAEKIVLENPDVLLIQEIDTKAKRSAYIDQVKWLINNTALNYAVYAPEWKGDFVIYDGVQRINTGNAILSKHLITGATRIELPKKKDSKIKDYFNSNNIILRAEINANSKINLVTSRITTDNKDDIKQLQLVFLLNELNDIHNNNEKFIFAGTLNALAPEATKTSYYEDAICSDTIHYSTVSDLLTSFYSFNSAIDASIAEKGWTYTGNKDSFWNRKLDYIFTNHKFSESSGITHQSIENGGTKTMDISDHAAISVLYQTNN